MSYDEQPDAPLHGECAAEIHRLEQQRDELAAQVEVLRDALGVAINNDTQGCIEQHARRAIGACGDAAATCASATRGRQQPRYAITSRQFLAAASSTRNGSPTTCAERPTNWRNSTDKQLIERIIEVAYEDAMGQSLRPKDRREVVRVCVAFLARIDAERGKSATAWLDPWTGNNVTTDYDAYGKKGTPLFLSPTIPEGMALVPIEPTDAMLKAADDGDREYTTRSFGVDMPTVSQGAYDHYCAMLAADQGERIVD